MTADCRSTNVPRRLISRPAHSSGSVIESGRSCVSKSMHEAAIMHQRNSIAPNPCQPKPKCHAAYAVATPVKASTSG